MTAYLFTTTVNSRRLSEEAILDTVVPAYEQAEGVEAYTEAADDGTVSIFVNFDDTVVSKVSFYAQALQNRAATVGANFSHLYDAETLEVLGVLV